MGLYRTTYFVGEATKPDTYTKISEMIEANSPEEATAAIKTKHPTDLVKITSVSQLR